MHTFFTTHIQAQQALLTQEEATHALRVLRLQQGELVEVVNGQGQKFKGEVGPKEGKELVIKRLSPLPIFDEVPLCSIAIAPPKNRDRWEWFLEKATEMGVHHIYPVVTKRSERLKLNIDRSQKIVVSALKQCKRSFLPTLHPLTAFPQLLSSISGQSLIASCLATAENHIQKIASRSTGYTVFIGPEGDFTSEEIEAALQHGLHHVSFGEVRYRTETAALVACNWVNFLNSKA